MILLAGNISPFQIQSILKSNELLLWDPNFKELPVWGSPSRIGDPKSTFSYPKASNPMSHYVCHDGKMWKIIFNRLGSRIKPPLALTSELPTHEPWRTDASTSQTAVDQEMSHLENPMKSYKTSTERRGSHSKTHFLDALWNILEKELILFSIFLKIELWENCENLRFERVLRNHLVLLCLTNGKKQSPKKMNVWAKTGSCGFRGLVQWDLSHRVIPFFGLPALQITIKFFCLQAIHSAVSH